MRAALHRSSRAGVAGPAARRPRPVPRRQAAPAAGVRGRTGRRGDRRRHDPDGAKVAARVDGKRPALVASIGDIKVGRRLGYGPFAFIEHGAGKSYLGGGRRATAIDASYAGGPDRDDVGLFLVPGPDPAERWRAAYPGARVEVVGSPRAEALPARGPGPGPVVAVSFHWPAPMSLSGYAGTAAGEYFGELERLAARFTVIGHAHPKGDWPERMRRQYAQARDRRSCPSSTTCADGPTSTCATTPRTIFEFAATGRPVVLLNSRYWDWRVEAWAPVLGRVRRR